MAPAGGSVSTGGCVTGFGGRGAALGAGDDLFMEPNHRQPRDLSAVVATRWAACRVILHDTPYLFGVRLRLRVDRGERARAGVGEYEDAPPCPIAHR